MSKVFYDKQQKRYTYRETVTYDQIANMPDKWKHSPRSQNYLYPAHYWFCDFGTGADFYALWAKPAHTHSYTKKVQDKAPTCTATGSGHYECPTDGARNGATYSIPALGHNYGSWSNWTDISNTQQQRTQKCSRCSDVRKETRVRTYFVNISVLSPDHIEYINPGEESGYFRISTDKINWSDKIIDQPYDPCNILQYNQKLYIEWLGVAKTYLELKDVYLLKESADIYSESAEVQSKLSHTYERISWLNGQFNAYKELS